MVSNCISAGIFLLQITDSCVIICSSLFGAHKWSSDLIFWNKQHRINFITQIWHLNDSKCWKNFHFWLLHKLWRPAHKLYYEITLHNVNFGAILKILSHFWQLIDARHETFSIFSMWLFLLLNKEFCVFKLKTPRRSSDLRFYPFLSL